MKSIADILSKEQTQWRTQLRDDRWRARKRKFLQSFGGHCSSCRQSKPLDVHHVLYEPGLAPWEYDDLQLKALCRDCHNRWHNAWKAMRMLLGCTEVTDLELIYGTLKVGSELKGIRWCAIQLQRALEGYGK